ncbi:MAG: polymer-forming cytoskeletal protein [Gammaproteobacteria bacterium]|nr:polymer-forming cytoskeletal protein [Gammaproteobacteria bacterium]
MSMFDKRSAKEPSDAGQARRSQQASPAAKPEPQAVAIVGPGINVSGEVSGNEDLFIDGKVEGTIDLRDNVVTVNQSGEVRANITASTVNVSGRVVGDIVGIEQVVLTKSAWVLGNVIAPRVNLESGGKFKGTIDTDSVEKAEKVEQKEAQKPKASNQQSPTQAAAPLAAASVKAEAASVKRAVPSPRESAART